MALHTTLYKFAAGFNNAGSLALLNPQPKTRMTQWATRNYGLSGSAYSQGRYCELIWDALTIAQFNALITLFGISETVDTAQGTWALRHDDGTYYNANAIVNYPYDQQDKQRALGYWSRATFRLTHVVPL